MLFAEQLPIKIFTDKILLNVKITPNASRNRIGSIFNNSLKIYVTAIAENGQANKFVLNLLAEKLGINKNCLCIVQGATAQNKTVSIEGNPNFIIKNLQIIIND